MAPPRQLAAALLGAGGGGPEGVPGGSRLGPGEVPVGVPGGSSEAGVGPGEVPVRVPGGGPGLVPGGSRWEGVPVVGRPGAAHSPLPAGAGVQRAGREVQPGADGARSLPGAGGPPAAGPREPPLRPGRRLVHRAGESRARGRTTSPASESPRPAAAP